MSTLRRLAAAACALFLPCGAAFAQAPSAAWVLQGEGSPPFMPPPAAPADMRLAAGERWTVAPLPDGRWLAFDQYRFNTPAGLNLAAVGAAQPIVIVQNDPSMPQFFSEDELAIARSVQVRIGDTSRTYAAARVEDGRRIIEVSPALVNLANSLASALVRQSRGDDPDGRALRLVLMSELDQAYGRNAWYLDGRMAWAHGWALTISPPEYAVYQTLSQGMVTAVLMHELCHHLHGDEEPARLASLEAAPPAEAQWRRRQAELDADTCSAQIAGRFGFDARFQLIPLWLSSVFDRNSGDSPHPPFADRVANIEGLGGQVVSIAAQSGHLAPVQVQRINDSVARMVAFAAEMDASAALDEAAELRRGRWPDCPFGGTIASNCR